MVWGRWLGAALLITSSGCAGLRAAGRLHESVHRAEELLRMTDRMETLVCQALLPLPEVIGILRKEAPDLFRPSSGMESLSEIPFAELWRRVFDSGRIPASLPEPVGRLGDALSRGGDPGRGFAVCRRELEAEKAAFLQRVNSSARVYVGLGFAAGCILAVLLL